MSSDESRGWLFRTMGLDEFDKVCKGIFAGCRDLDGAMIAVCGAYGTTPDSMGEGRRIKR